MSPTHARREISRSQAGARLLTNTLWILTSESAAGGKHGPKALSPPAWKLVMVATLDCAAALMRTPLVFRRCDGSQRRDHSTAIAEPELAPAVRLDRRLSVHTFRRQCIAAAGGALGEEEVAAEEADDRFLRCIRHSPLPAGNDGAGTPHGLVDATLWRRVCPKLSVPVGPAMMEEGEAVAFFLPPFAYSLPEAFSAKWI